MQPGNSWDVFDTEAAYITFVETLGMSAETDVTIKGHAFIKGSVYGGSENGHVLHDTYVKIQDHCQVMVMGRISDIQKLNGLARMLQISQNVTTGSMDTRLVGQMRILSRCIYRMTYMICKQMVKLLNQPPMATRSMATCLVAALVTSRTVNPPVLTKIAG